MKRYSWLTGLSVVQARFVSVPFLYMWPDFLNKLPGAAAVENIEVLVRHGIRVLDVRHFLHTGEASVEISLLAIQNDHAFAGILPRSPEKVVLMSADGWRQAIQYDQRDQGRLIHISPGKVLAARDVVQLVAKEAVMQPGIKMDQQPATAQASRLIFEVHFAEEDSIAVIGS